MSWTSNRRRTHCSGLSRQAPEVMQKRRCGVRRKAGVAPHQGSEGIATTLSQINIPRAGSESAGAAESDEKFAVHFHNRPVAVQLVRLGKEPRLARRPQCVVKGCRTAYIHICIRPCIPAITHSRAPGGRRGPPRGPRWTRGWPL